MLALSTLNVKSPGGYIVVQFNEKVVEFIILYFGMLFQSLGGGSEVLILTNLLSEIQPTPLQSSNFN